MRRSQRLPGISVVLFVFGFSVAVAAPPRQWTDSSGKFSVKAELVEIKDGQVHLKKADDGEVITVPVARLSDADRNYLSNRGSARPAVKAPTETNTPDAPAKDDAPEGDPAAALVKYVDADRNGKLVRSEWTALGERFRTLDADKSNGLSKSELEATGAADLLLQLADADDDGSIVRDEWVQFSQSFNRLDANKDVAVDRRELDAAAKSSFAQAAGKASLPATTTANAGPTVWRGDIQGRGQIELTVNGNTIVGREMRPGGQPGGSLGAGTFTMTGDGKFGNMDATYTEGQQAGQLCMGIYRLDGDTLQWCVSNRPGRRPAAFTPGNGDWLMTLTRVAGTP